MPLFVYFLESETQNGRNVYTDPGKFEFVTMQATLTFMERFPFLPESAYAETTEIRFQPPEDINVEPFLEGAVSTVITAADGWTNLGKEILVEQRENGPFYQTLEGFGFWEDPSLGWLHVGIGNLPDLPVPEGLWCFSVNGSPASYYDFGISAPLGDDGSILVVVPSIKLDVSEDGVINQIKINWMTYDPGQKIYQSMTDSSSFTDALEHVTVILGGLQGTYITVDSSQSTIELSETWKYVDGGPLQSNTISRVSIGYPLYGFDFLFTIHLN